MKYSSGEHIQLEDKVSYDFGTLGKCTCRIAGFTDKSDMVWVKTNIKGSEFMKVHVRELSLIEKKI